MGVDIDQAQRPEEGPGDNRQRGARNGTKKRAAISRESASEQKEKRGDQASDLGEDKEAIGVRVVKLKDRKRAAV